MTDTAIPSSVRASARRPRLVDRALSGPWLSVVGVGLALLAWELAARYGDIAGGLVVPFSTAVENGWSDRGFFLGETWYTARAALAGYALSVGIGVSLAVLIVSFRPAAKGVWPVIVMSQVIPKIAIAPVFLVWFGFDMTSKILIAFLLSFFPIVIDSVLGLRSTKLEQLYLARSTGAGRWRTFLRIRLPGALPSMFTGFKLGATFAVTGAIVGELVGSDRGIGRAIFAASARLNQESMYAGVLYAAILGFVAFYAIRVVEAVAIPWHVSKRKTGGGQRRR